jgi:hypothetical protein
MPPSRNIQALLRILRKAATQAMVEGPHKLGPIPEIRNHAACCDLGRSVGGPDLRAAVYRQS